MLFKSPSDFYIFQFSISEIIADNSFLDKLETLQIENDV